MSSGMQLKRAFGARYDDRGTRRAVAVLVAAFAVLVAACGAQVRPRVGMGQDRSMLRLTSVRFDVACDSCEVEWSTRNGNQRDTAAGHWHKVESMSNTHCQLVYVVAVPFTDDQTVRSAEIRVDGDLAASVANEDAGVAVELEARAGCVFAPGP